MIKKTISILFLSFSFQLIISCDYDCNRPKPEVFMEYTELIISAKVFDQKTNHLVDIQDSIQKKNFRLGISMKQERLTQQTIKVQTPFGFSSAKAIDCGPPLIYEYLINQINITMIDANNILPIKEVSTLFGYQSTDPSHITYIEKYLKEQTKHEPKDYFRLKCIAPDSLYDQAQFTVEVILESEKVFTKSTENIFFKD